MKSIYRCCFSIYRTRWKHKTSGSLTLHRRVYQASKLYHSYLFKAEDFKFMLNFFFFFCMLKVNRYCFRVPPTKKGLCRRSRVVRQAGCHLVLRASSFTKRKDLEQCRYLSCSVGMQLPFLFVKGWCRETRCHHGAMLFNV